MSITPSITPSTSASVTPSTSTTIRLGDSTPSAFLSTYWQKKPLVIRQAIPGFQGFVDVATLCAWAKKDSVAARLVTMTKGKRRLHTSPLHITPAQLPEKSTILVQGVENLHDEGWPLLMQFDGIIPRARLDDLMVSYATVGGGVGPHTDRYDVFLLQGPGRRRWRLQTTGDMRVDERQEVPTLKNFVPDLEHTLEAGDILYLPPGVAHDGVAVDGPCFTYSIGAIAPAHEALLQNFLGFLSQRVEASVDLSAMYEDPDLQAPTQPAMLSSTMTAKVASMLSSLRFGDDDVDEFLGRLLTGPKPTVTFSPPPSVQRGTALKARLGQAGVLRLARPSRGLVSAQRVFLNGEAVVVADDGARAFFAELFAQRQTKMPLPTTTLQAIDDDDGVFAFVENAVIAGQVVVEREAR
jgi:50S ribosomal protein L16 3-hydroxylase